MSIKSYLFDKAVDLTHDLENNMPVYPGDPPPFFAQIKTIQKDGVNISNLNLGSHTGTHVDAPRHFIEGGMTIDEIRIQDLIGEAVVADFSFKPIGDGITRSDIETACEGIQLDEGDILLCFTGCSEHWGDDSITRNFTYLTGEGARYVISKRIRAVGIDFLSIERFRSITHDTHRELLSHGIFIVESLSKELKKFLGQRILFMALPLKFKGGDGAPCRAFAVPISS
jgi:arylformamidase